MRKVIIWLTITTLITSSISFATFSDMENHWAKETVDYLNGKNIIDGITKDTYAPENKLNKDAFIKLLMVTLHPEEDYTYEDYWAEKYIEKAIDFGYIDKANTYNVPITRLEVVTIIHRAIGNVQGLDPMPFNDLGTLSTDDQRSIQTALELNIINGYPDNSFRPHNFLSRAEAAVITYALRTVILSNQSKYNLYYGINAYDQFKSIENKSLSQIDSVTFAWAYLSSDGIDLDKDNIYKHSRPTGYEEPLNFFKSRSIDTYLSIFTERDIQAKLEIDGIEETILNLSDDYNGIVMDMELVASEDWSSYIDFLKNLKEALPEDKQLKMTLQPRDLAYLGQVIDTVDGIILMLHDYDVKSLPTTGVYDGLIKTPIAPIQSFKTDLEEATEDLSEEHLSKISIQFNLSATQWQSHDNTLFDPNMDGTAYGAHPTYEMIEQRIEEEQSQGHSLNDFLFFSKTYKSPYLYFEEGIYQNSLWFENLKSIQEKMLLSSDLGITNFSIWRLGNIPDGNLLYDLNILDYILK